MGRPIPSIIELGGQQTKPVETPLREQILRGLRNGQSRQHVGTSFEHSRSLPTVLVYDDLGLTIYDEITQLKEYYPFQAELNLLQRHGKQIARAMFGQQSQKKHFKSKQHQGVPTSNGHSNGTKKDIPLKDEQSFDPLTNQLDGRSSRWGDYNSGSHNYGVNGHLSHQRAGSDGVVIELGAGALTKTKILLRALCGLLDVPNAVDSLAYWAVDLEHGQLVTTLTSLAENERDYVDTRAAHGKIHIRGVRASYEEVFPMLGNGGLHEEHEMSATKQGKRSSQSILWLGSSIGNFNRKEGADFLKRIADQALHPGDTILLGIDGCNDKAKIELAYNDPAGVTRDFILNGVQRAGEIIGSRELSTVNFDYISRFNEEIGAHEAFIRARRDLEISAQVTGAEPILIAKGELIAIEKSYKFNVTECNELFQKAGLRVIQHWQDEQGYSLYVLERPPFRFTSTVAKPEAFNMPSLDDWQHLWRAFDTITLDMVTSELLHTKPIDLRHICLFYIGHIPSFLDIHLSRFLKESYTEPAHYPDVFERGIDPNVDDPTQIHSHSEVPVAEEDWPTLGEILDYRDRVRARLRKVYADYALVRPTRRLARTLSMVYEHEALHAETLCYMLSQVAERIRMPPGFAVPNWDDLQRQWDAQVARDGSHARSRVLSFPRSTVVLGQDDMDGEDYRVDFHREHAFGWDNETPSRSIEVPAFRVSLLPVSNLDYLDFLRTQTDADRGRLVPSSWIVDDDGTYHIRVLPAPGRVSFGAGQHWPVQASAVQLTAYAASKGGRLPTEGELRRFYEDHPVDAPGRNVGFTNWHPLPPSLPVRARDGTEYGASNGGVWEWTSTDFDRHEGFTPSALYPLYSADFFDGHHAVVLGGSYLTIPRIAGRKSFRNFYQRKYPYTFAGARVAYDV